MSQPPHKPIAESIPNVRIIAFISFLDIYRELSQTPIAECKSDVQEREWEPFIRWKIY